MTLGISHEYVDVLCDMSFLMQVCCQIFVSYQNPRVKSMIDSYLGLHPKLLPNNSLGMTLALLAQRSQSTLTIYMK